MSSDPAYAEQDLSLALTFATAAQAARLQRIIYLGGLDVMGPGLSEHLTSRCQVDTALASTGGDRADVGEHPVPTDRD